MKGLGTTIVAIIIFIMIIAAMTFIVILVFRNLEKQRSLDLEEAAIIRTKNIFYLFNRSLATTMAVSSAQALFAAENVEEFWYNTDPNLPKQIVLPESECNSGNPKICLPNVKDTSDYMKGVMRKEFIEKMKEDIDLGGIAISVSVPPDGVLFWPAYSVVKSRIKENIIFDSKPSIDVSTSTNTAMKTNYRKMLHGGWLLVDAAMKMKGSGVAVDYKKSVEDAVDSEMNEVSIWLGSDIVLENEKTFSFFIPEDQSRLFLHYKITATMKDAAPGIASYTCGGPDIYDQMISDAVSSQRWSVSRSEAESLVKAVIQQESNWNPDAISCAGAAGLMQLMPDTASGLGLDVPNYPTTTVDCGGVAIETSVCNSFTPDKCDKVNDERFNPEKNIEGGAKYVHDQLNDFKKGDKINNIKLALAAYNCGPGCVNKAIKDAKSDKWEKVAPFTPQQTQNYVPAVLSCYGFYSGQSGAASTTDKPEWPTKTTKITDFYGSLWGIAEGYRTRPHSGIDIGAPSGEEVHPILAGTVEVAGDHSSYGKHVIIKHTSQLYSLYAHLSEIKVKKGDKVATSDALGKVGNTGSSKGAHLHLETRKSKDGNEFNPCLILDCTGSPGRINANVFRSQDFSYYHDVKNNQFVKKPFALRVVIDDYLTALDCTQNSGVFTAVSSDDVLCDGGTMYICATQIEGTEAMQESATVAGKTCTQGEWK